MQRVFCPGLAFRIAGCCGEFPEWLCLRTVHVLHSPRRELTVSTLSQSQMGRDSKRAVRYVASSKVFLLVGVFQKKKNLSLECSGYLSSAAAFRLILELSADRRQLISLESACVTPSCGQCIGLCSLLVVNFRNPR